MKHHHGAVLIDTVYLRSGMAKFSSLFSADAFHARMYICVRDDGGADERMKKFELVVDPHTMEQTIKIMSGIFAEIPHDAVYLETIPECQLTRLEALSEDRPDHLFFRLYLERRYDQIHYNCQTFVSTFIAYLVSDGTHFDPFHPNMHYWETYKGFLK